MGPHNAPNDPQPDPLDSLDQQPKLHPGIWSKDSPTSHVCPVHPNWWSTAMGLPTRPDCHRSAYIRGSWQHIHVKCTHWVCHGLIAALCHWWTQKQSWSSKEQQVALNGRLQWRRIRILSKACTWELVTCPENCNIVSSKWVYCLNCDANGKVVCYKARLVVQGYTQMPGMDFMIHSPQSQNSPQIS